MLEISFVILSVVFLLLVLFSIPVFLQMLRAVKNLSAALETLNQHLPEILKDAHDTVDNLKSASLVIREEVETLADRGRNIRAFLQVAKGAECLLVETIRKAPFMENIKTVRGLWRGIRVFFDTLQAGTADQAGEKNKWQR